MFVRVIEDQIITAVRIKIVITKTMYLQDTLHI